jgi:hypothetical protein
MNFSEASWRKTTDIDREYAVFELLHNGIILLDVGFSDENVFEIAFHEGLPNTIVDWDHFFAVLDKGRQMAEADK